MATGKNSYTLNVDIKQRMSNKTPRFVQYDSAQIIFKIYDNGKQYDLTPFTSAIVTHRLPDGKTIAGQAEFTELNGQRVVVYDYMGSEMEQEGNIETSVGLFVGDTQKVSIMPFNVEIVDDLGDHIDEDVEAKYSVLQVMIGEVTELNATMTANENTRQSNEATRRSQEIQRQTNEDTRKSNENTRISNENTRKTNEDTRKSDETARQSAEDTRVANETARASAEDTRKANETERQRQEGIRNTAETERLSNENSRVSAENTRESQESTRQTQESTRQTNTNNAIARLDTAVDSTKLEFKAPVETKAALSTTYSNAQVGWVAQVTTGEDAGKFFRYNGSTWEFQSEIALDAVTDIQNKLHRTDRKTETLIDGVNIVDAPVASPTDIEIQGRTMVSLGNSNLEKGKYYALTDEKYKVITDGKTVSGVGKFQKGETHKTVADFKGKVRESTTENPHYSGSVNNATSVKTPSDKWVENTQVRYTHVDSLDGVSSTYGIADTSGAISQHIFSFNAVEQVERTLGAIPGGSLTEKVSWLRNNAAKLQGNFYGYGSHPSGNKVTFEVWNGSLWIGTREHTNANVERLSISTETNVSAWIQNDGNIHLIAHTGPSDGTVASVVYSDYVSLDIELKPTAQLNTRPTIVRVENFEGKVNRLDDSVNPHRSYIPGNAYHDELVGLQAINSQNWFELRPDHGQANYHKLYDKADGYTHSTIPKEERAVGKIPQQLFSFNLIEAVERNIGKIPAIGTAEKAAWLRNNLSQIEVSWDGYGFSNGINRATLSIWRQDTSTWVNSGRFHGNAVDKNLSYGTHQFSYSVETAMRAFVGDDGFVHYIAHAEPTDGTLTAAIYTNYAELRFNLKPTADFRQPRIPLYEVSKEEYDRIGVTYTDEETKRRYPVVQGVQHLVNPYVVNPGENLLPPFTDPRWNLHANSTVKSAYEVEVNASAKYHANTIRIPVKPNATYIFSIGETQGYSITSLDSTGKSVEAHYNSVYRGPLVFTTHPEATYVLLAVFNNDATGIHVIREPMISPGTELKPFTPYNPSTLHAPVTLSAVGDNRDVLYQQDGRWYVRRAVRNVDLSDSIPWVTTFSFDDYFVVGPPDDYFSYPQGTLPLTTNNYGDVIPIVGTAVQDTTAGNQVYTGFNSSGVKPWYRITVTNEESGFPSNHVHNRNDTQRFFNGWRYTDGTTWESVTGNGQTATAEEALTTMPTDYTPYKLTYVLAEPEVIDVTDLVEGDIAVSGLTQIEVGAGEIVTEDEDGNRTYTRIPDNEKHNVTAAPDNVKITYEQNIRSAHDALVSDVVQNTSLLSIHERAIVNLFARIRGLELSADEIRQDLDDLRTDFDNLPEPTPPTDGGTA